MKIDNFKAKIDQLKSSQKLKYFSKMLKFFGHSFMVLLNAIYMILTIYAIVLTLALGYGAYRVYDYGYSIYQDVLYFKDHNPESSKYMQSYLKDLKVEVASDKKLSQNKLIYVDSNVILHHKFVPLDSISKTLVNSVLAAEDAGFYLHPGLDVGAIATAFQTNKQRGKNVFGGSTLTQQLAKNLFLSSERSWERKFKELVYALLMEKYLGKKRILELYLNYAQWGKNIFGVGAISEIYYKKSPLNLTYDQSIRLASLLAKPSKYTPYSETSIFLAKRRKVIVDNLFLSRKLGENFYKEYQGDSLMDSTISAYKGLDPKNRSKGEIAPVDASGSPLKAEENLNPVIKNSFN